VARIATPESLETTEPEETLNLPPNIGGGVGLTEGLVFDPGRTGRVSLRFIPQPEVINATIIIERLKTFICIPIGMKESFIKGSASN
jgi:hypothetical protein